MWSLPQNYNFRSPVAALFQNNCAVYHAMSLLSGNTPIANVYWAMALLSFILTSVTVTYVCVHGSVINEMKFPTFSILSCMKHPLWCIRH